jgi:hypothetical protein
VVPEPFPKLRCGHRSYYFIESRSFREGIEDEDSIIALSGVEVFGVECVALEFPGGGDDGGIPMGDLKLATENGG